MSSNQYHLNLNNPPTQEYPNPTTSLPPSTEENNPVIPATPSSPPTRHSCAGRNPADGTSIQRGRAVPPTLPLSSPTKGARKSEANFAGYARGGRAGHPRNPHRLRHSCHPVIPAQAGASADGTSIQWCGTTAHPLPTLTTRPQTTTIKSHQSPNPRFRPCPPNQPSTPGEAAQPAETPRKYSKTAASKSKNATSSQTPLTRKELTELTDAIGIQNLFSWRSPSSKPYRQRKDTITQDELIDAMLQEPRLIRRPILTSPNTKPIIGFNKTTYSQL